jgi:hypothetical protein
MSFTSGNITNLGYSAQANVVIANNQMLSPSYSQNEITVGTAASPSATATVAYVAGINKYIFYSPLTTATAITQEYSITGLPASFPSTYSVVGQNLAVASATFSTSPKISAAHLSFSGTTLFIQPLSSTSPVFASGTAYLKVVITFQLD